MEEFEDLREEWWFSCYRAGGQNNTNRLTQEANDNNNLKKNSSTLPTKQPLQTLETIGTLVNYNTCSFNYV